MCSYCTASESLQKSLSLSVCPFFCLSFLPSFIAFFFYPFLNFFGGGAGSLSLGWSRTHCTDKSAFEFLIWPLQCWDTDVFHYFHLKVNFNRFPQVIFFFLVKHEAQLSKLLMVYLYFIYIYFKYLKQGWAWWHTSLILAFRRENQAICEFKASRVYIGNFWLAKVM